MEDLKKIFSYHAPKGDQPRRYEVIRNAALTFAEVIVSCCPESADRTVAVRRVREAVMNANASIAIGETDLTADQATRLKEKPEERAMPKILPCTGRDMAERCPVVKELEKRNEKRFALSVLNKLIWSLPVAKQSMTMTQLAEGLIVPLEEVGISARWNQANQEFQLK